MTTYAPDLSTTQCTVKENGILDPTTHTGLPPVRTKRKSILKRHEVAKSKIETKLRRSAGILSEFTENTISRTNIDFHSLFSREKFGSSLNSGPDFQTKSRLGIRSEKTSSKNLRGNPSVAVRKRPDVSKLPISIANILRQDSNSSIPSLQKSKKYHYHSKKMALRQRDDSSSEKVHVTLTPSMNVNNTAPKIVLVSTSLTVQETPTSQDKKTSTTKMPENDNNNFEGTYAKDPKIDNVNYRILAAIKNEKKNGGNINVSSVVKKPEKMNIGVENGVAFILGTKSKSPYFNTFGDSAEDFSGDKSSPNRKWVVHVGNFLDNEISIAMMDNNLTVTGSRPPSLNYPEGQVVSETIPLPPEFDVHNLRIYRAKDARAFLVIQEKH